MGGNHGTHGGNEKSGYGNIREAADRQRRKSNKKIIRD
jgi:hypothetical protein